MSELHHSRKWTNLKNRILKRDKYQCRDPFGKHINPKLVGGRHIETKNIEIHHINPAEMFPEDFYKPDNCIALCEECHKHAHRLLKRDVVAYESIMESVTKSPRGGSNPCAHPSGDRQAGINSFLTNDFMGGVKSHGCRKIKNGWYCARLQKRLITRCGVCKL